MPEQTASSASGPVPRAGGLPAADSGPAWEAFAAAARAAGLDPHHPWVGGYVNYEWPRMRPLLAAYGIDPAGLDLLEFGCNVGASAIVYALLGATVRAIDVDAAMVGLARLNAERYDCPQIAFSHVPDTRQLPFPDASFDLVSCNSVLEYVAPDQLAAVQREIDRVLKPGGLILITGTSSRLWPREVHSHLWFVNWLPRRLDPLLPGSDRFMRGVWPWAVRAGFGPRYRNLDALDRGRAFIAARANMSPRQDTPVHHAIAWVARRFGIGPGLLMNNVSCVLRKPVSVDAGR